MWNWGGRSWLDLPNLVAPADSKGQDDHRSDEVEEKNAGHVQPQEQPLPAQAQSVTAPESSTGKLAQN